MRKMTRVALLVSSVLLAATQASATVTSSGIRGQLLDAQGNPLAGVTVEVVHKPTGSRKTFTTTQNGIFQSSGLTVGGPYTVKLKDGSQHKVANITDLFLKLGVTASVELQVAKAANIEVISVKGTAAMAGAFKKGPGSEYSEDDIASTAAISRDFKSLLKRSSKVMVDPTADGGPALSIAGGSVRGNSLTVDGVKQNDDFGLNKNGYPGRRSPIALDAIEQLSVNIAPFDVTYGDFQGGNINVVTKSGTNEFHGSASYYRSDDRFIGDDSEGEDLNIGDFSEDTYGVSIGGPIIEDKLFFFASYEKFESTKPYQFTLDNENGTVEANEKIGITQGDFDRIASIAQSVWNYDIGGYAVPKEEEAKNLLIKLDWYINDDHRTSLTYQDNEGNSVRDYWGETFPNTPWTTSESNRYNQTETLEALSFQLFSDWSADFSTEFKYSTKEVNTSQDPLLGANFGQMLIGTPHGGQLYIGPDQFRHANTLGNDRTALGIKGDYYLNDEHKLTFGWEHETLDIANMFVFGSLGMTEFASIEDFEANLGFHVFQNALDGNPQSALDKFEFTVDTFYVQDEWSATDDLTMTYGLRYSKYSNDDKPTLNTDFVARQGYNNQGNFDGLSLLEPRIGFTYTYDQDTIIRGGAGLFGGGGPNVWLSNSYGNDGRRKTFAGCFGGCFDGRTMPQEVLDFLAAGGFNGGNGDTNSIHPDFEIPSMYKYNIGLERRQDLGFLGEDWLFTADVIISDVKDAAKYRELNITQTDTAPDGRPIYSAPPQFDLSLENANKGGGIVTSIGLAKTFYSEYGTFSFDVNYSYQDLTEVNPGNAFVAFEGYSMPANDDFQNNREYNSEYEIRHNMTSNLTWSNEIFGDNTTTISIAYTGRSGRHYSHTMRSAGTFGGFVDFASWDGYNSQSLYIPTGADDPLVTFGAGFETDRFFNYINSRECLSDNKGKISRRHSCRSAQINRFDVRFMQEIQITDDQAIELTMDIENIGNMLNDSWGRAEGYVQPFNAPVVDVTIVDGQYVYNKFSKPKASVNKVASVWKVQLGIKYRF
ncbi:MAG: outer membrane receptor for ferrienterochelin and colicin [Phenylobacterium sp.]|jgi:outer membrane receptor for ferrienterochelin and colicin